MNIFSIVEELEKIDPELNDRFNPRRSAIKNITSFGSKVAMAAAPFALGTLFKRAYGQSVGDVVGVLSFALKLEYLEYEYYNIGVNTSGLIPVGSGMTALSTIRDHEASHVAYLKNAIGATAPTRASQGFTVGTQTYYDFSGGNGAAPFAPTSLDARTQGRGAGPLSGVFDNYDLYLALAQVFEDTGVRAYKGQAPNLINNAALAPALRIHSVEARHASHLRQMRRARGLAGATVFPAPVIKPWITGANDTAIPSSVVGPNYLGEDNTTQGGADLTTLVNIATGAKFTTNMITEAFDEPLTATQVLPLVTIFGVK